MAVKISERFQNLKQVVSYFAISQHPNKRSTRNACNLQSKQRKSKSQIVKESALITHNIKNALKENGKEVASELGMWDENLMASGQVEFFV